MKRDVIVGRAHARLRAEGGVFDYERTGGGRIHGGYEMHALGPDTYLVRIGRRSYRVAAGQRGEVCVNGRIVPVEVFDPRDVRQGGRAQAGSRRQHITAPMPGKVIRLLVAPGDVVEAGQGLVVVEAMKMQNEIKAPQAGRVAEVRTQAGAAAGAGDVLVILE